MPHGKALAGGEFAPMVRVLEVFRDQPARQERLDAPKRRDAFRVERHHRHMPCIRLQDFGNAWLVPTVAAPRALDLEQQRHLTVDDGKQALERQDMVAAVPQWDGAEIRGVSCSDRPSLYCETVQSAIVKDNRQTISRALQVDLDGGV